MQGVALTIAHSVNPPAVNLCGVEEKYCKREAQQEFMTEPIRSPDGEWIWSGSAWLAAPPSLDQGGLGGIEITDQTRTRDAVIPSAKDSAVPHVLLKDSAMTGNITIHQSNADDIVSGVMDALDSFGLSNRFAPGRLTRNQCGQVRQVLDLSESLSQQHIEIDPYIDLRLGDAAELAGWNDAAQGHYDRAMKHFKSSGDKKGEARSYHGLGRLEERRGDYKRAERYERESLSLARVADDPETQADALTGLGHLLSQQGKFAEADSMYKESLSLYRQVGDRVGQANALNHLGHIPLVRGDVDKADRLFEESWNLHRRTGDRYGEAKALANRAHVASKRGLAAEAERMHTECLAIHISLNDPSGQARSEHNLGLVALSLNDYDKAEEWFRKSLALLQDIEDKDSTAATMGSLGVIAVRKGYVVEGERLIRHAHQLFVECGHKAGEATSLINLAAVASLRDDVGEQRRLNSEAISIRRALGLPIHPWFIQQGY